MYEVFKEEVFSCSIKEEVMMVYVSELRVLYSRGRGFVRESSGSPIEDCVGKHYHHLEYRNRRQATNNRIGSLDLVLRMEPTHISCHLMRGGGIHLQGAPRVLY